MGMFDWVSCEAKLPEPEPMDNANTFQTKDTACNLDLYTIQENGNLVVQRFDCDEDPQLSEPEKSDFHGFMNFYGNTQETGRWKEYRAKFTDGVMMSVELVEPCA